MFELGVKGDNKDKHRKALLCAGLITCIIFLLYVILTRGKLYTFSGVPQDITPFSSILKDASKNIGEDISHGSNVINKK